MKIGIAVFTEAQKLEIADERISGNGTIQWVYSTEALLSLKDVDLCIDCTYFGTELTLYEKPTLVHSPALSLANVRPGSSIARFCAWPSFLSRETWEVSVVEQSDTRWLEKLTGLLGRRFLIVKDELGLVAPRIVCAIINEAYHALQAGISTAEEIDVAMKLGTNYPYGPLEWSKKIGLQNVHNLLKTLSKTNPMYQPAFQIKGSSY